MLATLPAAAAAQAVDAATDPPVQDPRRGPLFVRSRAPVWDNRLAYVPTPAAVLGRGQLAVAVGLSHVNTWAQMPGYFFDGEWSRLQLRLRVGLGKRTEATVDLAGLGRSGGRLDGAIERFHAAFGLTQSRRNLYPRDQLRVARGADKGHQEQVLGPRDSGFGRGKPSLGLRHALWQGPRGERLVAELHLGLPLGDQGRDFASRGWEGLGALGASAALGRFVTLAVATGASVSPGAQPVYGMATSKVQKFLFVALVAPLGRHLELALQYLNQDGAVEEARFTPLHKTTHEFALGLRGLVSRHWALEVGIIENTIHDANTPDVGLHVALLGVNLAR